MYEIGITHDGVHLHIKSLVLFYMIIKNQKLSLKHCTHTPINAKLTMQNFACSILCISGKEGGGSPALHLRFIRLSFRIPTVIVFHNKT